MIAYRYMPPYGEAREGQVVGGLWVVWLPVLVSTHRIQWQWYRGNIQTLEGPFILDAIDLQLVKTSHMKS